MSTLSKLLDDRSIAHELIRHPPTYDAQRLAEAVETTGHAVAKTVVLKSDVDYVLVVLPATCRVNLDAAKQYVLSDHVVLATEEEIADRFSGCETGAVPPFGAHYGMLTLLDESLAEMETIVFDSETHDKAIRMRMSDYLNVENPVICEVAQVLRER